MKVRIHPHAAARTAERGATEEEVIKTIETGEQFPGKFGRTGFRRNFPFTGLWRGRPCATKQIEAYAVQENGDWIVSHHSYRQIFLGGPTVRLEYDSKHNIAYIRFLEGRAEDLQTLHVSEEFNVDMTPDGRIYGIELLNANEQLFRQDAGKLVIEDRSSGRLETVSLVEEV